MLHRLSRATPLVAALTLLLAACSASAPATTGPQPSAAPTGAQPTTAGPTAAATGEQVQLRVMWWGNDRINADWQATLDLYESKNPNVKFVREFMGFGEYWDRLATQVAGGTPPDLIKMSRRYLAEYASRGALLDLTPYIPDPIDTSAQLDGLYDQIAIDGKIYAVNTGVEARALLYNPDLIEAAGAALPTDDASWTWEALGELAQQISDNSDGVYGIADPGWGINDFEVYLQQQGKELYDADGNLGFAEEDLVNWWTMTDSWRRSGAATPAEMTVADMGGSAEEKDLPAGRAAFEFWTQNHVGTAASTLGHDVALIRHPGEDPNPGIGLLHASMMTASANTAHPEEVVDFINFLINDPEGVDAFGIGQGMMPNTEIAAQLEDSFTDFERQELDYFNSLQGRSHAAPRIEPAGAGAVDELFRRQYEEVIFERQSIADAVAQFFSEAPSLITN